MNGSNDASSTRSLAAVMAVVAVLALAPAGLASAADFVVDSTADLADASPGDGSCATGGGQCTLRAAVQEANVLGVSSSITLPAGTYTLTIAGRNEDQSATGDLDIRAPLALTGAGAGTTIIRAGADTASGIDRLLHVHEVTFQLADVTLEHGRLIDAGVAGNGGGLLNNGTSTVVRTRIRACSGAGSGGGIQTTGTATLVLSESLIDGNWASDGGGLSVAGGGVTDASNVTFSGNSSTSLGGGVSVAGGGTLNLANASIVGNYADAVLGGGISNAGTVNVKNSILADNTNQLGTPGNCSGSVVVTSGGFNLEDASTCGLAGSGDQSSTDPQIGPLASNGGPTATHALAVTSPAVDNGNPGGCTTAQGGPMPTDQRGATRPVDGDGNTSALCDVGAYELQPSLIFADGFESAGTGLWSNTVG